MYEEPIGKVINEPPLRVLHISKSTTLNLLFIGGRTVASYDGQGAYREAKAAFEAGAFNDLEATQFVRQWLQIAGHQETRYPRRRPKH